MKKLLIVLLILLLPAVASADQLLRHYATGAVALDSTLAPGHSFKIVAVRIHLSSAAGSENFTMTLDSGLGAAYDCEFYAKDLNGLTSWAIPLTELPEYIWTGDEVDFAWANTGTVTYGLEVIYTRVE
jgi:hypothetical protein